MYGGSGSLFDGLGAGLFGDSSCYSAVANAGLKCLTIPIDLRAVRADLVVAFGAGIALGSLVTVLLLRSPGEPSAAAASPAPVNVSVNQRVSSHGPNGRHARRSEPVTEIDHQSMSDGTSISGGSLRVRPVRGRAGALA